MGAVHGVLRRSFIDLSSEGSRDELAHRVCGSMVHIGETGDRVEHLMNELRAQGQYKGGRANRVQRINI